MGKTVSFETLPVREARLVAGMSDRDRTTEYELYTYCADYFYTHYQSIFFVPDTAVVDEMLQETFITFWEKIEHREIYAQDGQVMGRQGEPFKGSIRSYFMSVAKNKFREWTRGTLKDTPIDPNGLSGDDYTEDVFTDEKKMMRDIVADVLAAMSERCREILVKFYYEEKTLDSILQEIPSIQTKDALKTKKNKCMNSIRETSNSIYERCLKEQ